MSDLLTPSEVGATFRVDPKTVSRWAASGRLACVKTPGGHNRFRRTDVEALLSHNAETREGAMFEEEAHGTVKRFEGDRHTGSVWGPAMDNGYWFVCRLDLNDGATLKLPTRDDAVEYLRSGKRVIA